MKKIIKFVLAIIAVIYILSSCTPPSERVQKHVLYTSNITQLDTVMTVDNTVVINDPYFEITLRSYTNNLKAMNTVVEFHKQDNGIYTGTESFVTDENGNEIEFKTTTEFLNYMAAREYKMVDKIESKYKVKYTFNKI